VFAREERDRVRQYILDMARNDPRVIGGAETGSMAVDGQDAWSDLDLAFGLVEDAGLEEVLADWTEVLDRDLRVVHYWDLRAGPRLFRVFLFPNAVEVDVSVMPEEHFGSRGPSFRTLFGEARQFDPPPSPDPRFLVGLCWHHVAHARSSIERAKPWRVEYWISALRDHTLELICLRLGEKTAEARGFDSLPVAVTSPFADALVRSLDESELRRALAAAASCFLAELELWDRELWISLSPIVRKFGGLSVTPL
jgi:hypothetical protein